MNPDDMKAYQAAQLRQQALTLADKRAPTTATTDDVMAAAEKLLAFLQGGGTVAAPTTGA